MGWRMTEPRKHGKNRGAKIPTANIDTPHDTLAHTTCLEYNGSGIGHERVIEYKFSENCKPKNNHKRAGRAYQTSL